MATRAGLLTFIRAQGITVAALPDASTDIDNALALALEIVNLDLQSASPVLYDQAVYNLSVNNLIAFASDQPNSQFFANARVQYKMAGFVAGVIASTSDEGTSTSLSTPHWAERASIAELQYLKNPWGRQYLEIAQQMGTMWGIT